jgi:hypothetical protein
MPFELIPPTSALGQFLTDSKLRHECLYGLPLLLVLITLSFIERFPDVAQRIRQRITQKGKSK